MDSPRTMIKFDAAGWHFTYRVGGILLHDGHVLCQRALVDGFWFLPGGRAELGEAAAASLQREMQEELGLVVQVERLVYVLENFFRETHELGMYFLITAPADAYLYQSLATFKREDELGILQRFDWLPLAQLAHLPLFPTFFQKALQYLPDHTAHYVHYDEHDVLE
jgi:ADP-ribose pyrophosphatase YjhB (NUDIX family)